MERKPIKLDSEKISTQIKGKRVMITGGAGSIGSEIVRQLLSFSPHKIIILDQAETPLHFLSSEMEKLSSEIKISTIIKHLFHICDTTDVPAANWMNLSATITPKELLNISDITDVPTIHRSVCSFRCCTVGVEGRHSSVKQRITC